MGKPLAPCGTRAAYNRGCRCSQCGEANNAYATKARRLAVGTGHTDYHPSTFDAQLLAERAAVAHAWERMRARVAS